MLFVFAQPDFHGIWMKNCKFPIDILWLDDERKVVHVDENVPPCTARDDKLCEVYYPLRRAWYVVEINAGQARREKAVVGSSVDCPANRSLSRVPSSSCATGAGNR